MPKRKKFFMTFYEDLARLSGVYNQDGLFFAHMVANANPQTMTVHLSSELKAQIMEEIGSTAKHLSNAADQSLKRLKKQNLIKSIGIGAYMIQPQIHGFNNAVDKINTLSANYLSIKVTHDKKRRMRTEIKIEG